MSLLFIVHLWLVAAVPPEIGAMLYSSAGSWGDRYDLAAVMISEHSSRRWDFSAEGALSRWADGKRSPTYDLDAEGSRGERGLFQLWRGWAGEAGFDSEALWTLEGSTEVAAYAVAHMQYKHDGCSGDHEWIAHYKCQETARDDRVGACRYAQNKWQALRRSLVSLWTPDDYYEELGDAQSRRVHDYHDEVGLWP